MQNIRLSINLLSLSGARVVKLNNPSGTPEVYVAIPVSQCFVPTDKPNPRLMATMIHTPNAQYGDFMIKPYMSNADYKMLSKEEQMNLPIIGKGTFMQVDQNRLLNRAAETVEATDVDPADSVTPQRPTAPAATLPNAPSPRVAGQTTNAPIPSRLNNEPTMEPAQVYIVDSNNQALAQCSSIEEAANSFGSHLTASAIVVWQGNKCVRQLLPSHDGTSFVDVY